MFEFSRSRAGNVSYGAVFQGSQTIPSIAQQNSLILDALPGPKCGYHWLMIAANFTTLQSASNSPLVLTISICPPGTAPANTSLTDPQDTANVRSPLVRPIVISQGGGVASNNLLFNGTIGSNVFSALRTDRDFIVPGQWFLRGDMWIGAGVNHFSLSLQYAYIQEQDC